MTGTTYTPMIVIGCMIGVGVWVNLYVRSSYIKDKRKNNKVLVKIGY